MPWKVSVMWKNDRRGAASAVRQGVLSGKSRLAAVAIGAMLCVAALVAAYMAWRGAAVGDNRPPRAMDGTAGASRHPKAKVDASVEREPDPPARNPAWASPLTNAAAKAKAAPKETWLGREIVKTTAVTNGTDLVITRIDTEGKVHKEYTSIRRRLFTNPVDIVLSILLTTPEGAPVPPLPPLGPRADDMFAESLRRPIEVTDEDSEQDARVKRLVMAAREEMLDELAAGRSVNDVIEAHCTYAEERNTLRAEATVNYRDILAKDGEAAAEEYRARANELLSRHGASPIRSVSEIRASRNSRRRNGGVQ